MKMLAVVNPVWLVVLCLSARAADLPRVADAAKEGETAELRALLEQGEDVNAQQVDGMTALHWVAYHDDVTAVRLLLAAGGKVDTVNRYGVPPLWIACQNGNGEIVRALLEAGADANASLRGGETVLMTAARTGNLESVQALLTRGAEVNAHERKRQTAIMWAAAEGNAEVVQALIDAGADFRETLKSGFNPMFFAVREGRAEVVRCLLAAGVDVNEAVQPDRSSGKGVKAGMTALTLAVENGHFDLAVQLLQAGADPNADGCGYTPLHAITWVRRPLRGDTDPPPIGSGKLTSLEFVRALAAFGADVNARHRKHRVGNDRLSYTDATPFLMAAETGDIQLMKLLLELGAEPHVRNADNDTPLLAAAGVGVLGNGDESAGTEEEAIEAVQMLLELGADINAVDDRGNTAMHGAAYKSWTKMVQFLSDQGADIKVWNQPNKRGWTPLVIAQGQRPGNYRPSPETVAAVERVMRVAGVEPVAAK